MLLYGIVIALGGARILLTMRPDTTERTLDVLSVLFLIGIVTFLAWGKP